jgi:hypothetical protein
MIRPAARALLILAALLTSQTLASCQAHRDPFLMVQLCPGGLAGEAKLKQLFQNLAQSNGLTFIDGNPGEFSLKGGRGRWVLVTHAGALENQTVIAFFEPARDTQIRDLAKTATAQLAQQWAVEALPAGATAQPKVCPQSL